MTDGVDKREAILVRLLQIVTDIEDIENAARNQTLSDASDIRRISVLEGEEIVPEMPIGNRRASDKSHVMMIPQILIACGARTRDVGSVLNTFRRRVIKNVLTDEALLALTMNGRSIQYGGMSSDLAFAALMEGKMALVFRITYMLDPSAL
jgi:hypothetical protein